MKILKTLIVAFLFTGFSSVYAQTADEIINNYLQKTGGKEAWNNLKATKMNATVSQGGMEIPLTIYNEKDGKQAVVINLKGQTFTQLAFNGETMWTTNFMTMEPEKSDQEMVDNMKLNSNDFPSPLLNYKQKGYEVDYEGTETKNGIETYKIKLTQEPVMVKGVETPSISYYYFDKVNFVPVLIETTQMGQTMQIGMSDYKEVDGLYFPFSLTQGGQPIIVKEIALNPEIDSTVYAFPEKK
ncbi:MAG: outer membrane lipoprotein-sorting protein [Leeuwenhoekiella sp.]